MEWAQVYDNYYGTPRQYVEEVLERGNDCILEIDPQGAFQVRAAWPEAILIFIAPPSLEELRSRLSGRGNGIGGRNGKTFELCAGRTGAEK